MRPQSYRFCFGCAVLAGALALAFLFLPASVSAGQDAKKPAPVSFIKDIAPILKENCFACHDAKKRKGKFDMSTYESFRKGGDKEDPIVPGKPDESHLIDVLTAKDNSRMPPKEAGDPLDKAKINLIERWIREGARLDPELTAKSDIIRELRQRWQPPEPPAAYKFPVNINALCFSPDDKKLLVGGYHEITVWDIEKAKLEKRLKTRAERAYAMTFLADGKLAVAGGRPGQEGDVRIYDIASPNAKDENGVKKLDGVNDKSVLVKVLLDADDAVLSLALSPDKKKLASGGCDRLVNVWDVSGGVASAKLEQTVENHADWVFGLVFAPDGKHLLSVSRDKTAKVWDLSAKESVLTFPDHQNAVYGVAVKADGKQGISVGEDNQVRFWNATGDGKQVRASGGHSKPIYKVVMHPKQAVLVTASADGSLKSWNADNGQALKTFSGHTDYVYALALSSDGALCASGSWNGEVKVWKVADGSLVKSFSGSPGLPQGQAANAKQ